MKQTDETAAILGELGQFREELESGGYSDALLRVDVECQTLWRVVDEEFEEAIARFHHLAGKIPTKENRDYGALVLELISEKARGPRRQCLLRHALYRAQWATGDLRFGTRSSEDWNRIRGKLPKDAQLVPMGSGGAGVSPRFLDDSAGPKGSAESSRGGWFRDALSWLGRFLRRAFTDRSRRKA